MLGHKLTCSAGLLACVSWNSKRRCRYICSCHKRARETSRSSLYDSLRRDLAGWNFGIPMSDLPIQWQQRHMQGVLPGMHEHHDICCCLPLPTPTASSVETWRLQAGDHSGHDYALYFSQGGGCCDCGDSAAWSPSGFCHKHSGQTTEEQLQLEPLEAMTLAAMVSWAVYQLCWTLHICVQTKGLQLHGAVSCPANCVCSCCCCTSRLALLNLMHMTGIGISSWML